MDIDLVQSQVIERFGNLYGAANTPDPVAFKAEYTRALGGTDPDLLRAAIDFAIDGHTYQTWPTVGDCKAAVQVVAARRESDRKRRDWNGQDERAWHHATPESRARVGALMKEAVKNLQEGGWDLAKEKRKWAARQEAKAIEARLVALQALQAESDQPEGDRG